MSREPKRTVSNRQVCIPVPPTHFSKRGRRSVPRAHRRSQRRSSVHVATGPGRMEGRTRGRKRTTVQARGYGSVPTHGFRFVSRASEFRGHVFVRSKRSRTHQRCQRVFTSVFRYGRSNRVHASSLRRIGRSRVQHSTQTHGKRHEIRPGHGPL